MAPAAARGRATAPRNIEPARGKDRGAAVTAATRRLGFTRYPSPRRVTSHAAPPPAAPARAPPRSPRAPRPVPRRRRRGAQLVTPKTLPVFQDAQFDVAPSSRPGLGSAFIALEDTLGDPFVNPAKAVRLRGVSASAAPFTHGISGDRGGGRTLPVALLAGGDEWAGGVLLAYQSLDREGPARTRPTSERTANNQYLAGMLARRVGRSRSAPACRTRDSRRWMASTSSTRAATASTSAAASPIPRRRAARVRPRTRRRAARGTQPHRHDARRPLHLLELGPGNRTSVRTEREDHNLDQTNISGLHARYYRPIGPRAGAWAASSPPTASRIRRSPIRHPGRPARSGHHLGLRRRHRRGERRGPMRFFDRRRAGATREQDVGRPAARHDRRERRGHSRRARTIENTFDFHNARARIGAGHSFALNTYSSTTLGFDSACRSTPWATGCGRRTTLPARHAARRSAGRR